MNDRRVAFVLSSLAGGGHQRVVLTLAKEFAERGFDVDLVVERAEGPYLSQIPGKVGVVDLKAKRAALSLFPLVSYLRRRRPRALVSGSTHGNIMAILAWKLARVDTRMVISAHNTISVATRNSPHLRGRYVALLARLVYPCADAIVAVSKGAADDLVDKLRLPRAKVETIYNPVVTLELLEKAAEELDHPWFRYGEPPVILGVGQLTRQKDFPTLLRAFALVHKECAARLLILGEGEDRSSLESLIADLGITSDVEMPGFVDNPYKYMSRASVFALSSIFEGLPTVLIEAMACGTRLISTDCPSGPREILGGGKYGLLVPVGDVGALAAVLSETLADGSRVALPQPEAWSRFTPDVVLLKYEEIMLGRNRG